MHSTELDIYRFWRIHSLWQVSLVKQGTLTRPEHLVPPPRHNALMFGWSTCCEIYMYIDVCMCIHACICTYICVFTCIWMYVCECVFMHVYYNILYLLIVSVSWILIFEQRMVIWSYWYIFKVYLLLMCTSFFKYCAQPYYWIFQFDNLECPIVLSTWQCSSLFVISSKIDFIV